MGTDYSLICRIHIYLEGGDTTQPTYRILNNFTKHEFDAGSLTAPVVGADYLLEKRTYQADWLRGLN